MRAPKVMGPVFTLLGCILLGVGVHNIRGAEESKSWPTVEGEITTAEVLDKRKPGERHSTYKARIEYQYSVEGVAHSGDRVSFAGDVSSSNRGAASELTARYREGSKVAIYYDPEDPSDSVLEPGMTAMVYLFPAIGGLFLVIGVGILIFLLLSRSSSKEL